MTDRQKQISIGAGAMLVVLTGVVYWFWRPANNANVPRGVWFICSNQQCKNEFSMTMAEFSDHHARHYGQPVTCPKCKSVAIKADKCPSCGKVFFMQRNSDICPACGKHTGESDAQSLAPGRWNGDVAIGLTTSELLVVVRDPTHFRFDRPKRRRNVPGLVGVSPQPANQLIVHDS